MRVWTRGTVGPWRAGRSAARRIAAILRAAHRVLGLNKKRLGLGLLVSLGGAAAAHAQVTIGGNDQGFGIGTTSRSSVACIAIGGSGSFSATTQCGNVDSLAIGNNAKATGQTSQAIGTGAVAGAYGSLAVGNAATAPGTTATALGSSATASNANDVALGSNSTTASAVATSTATINGKAYAFAGASPTSTVSIGSASSQRTLTNLASGTLGSTSTDAVNGSQLYATNQAVGTLGSLVTTLGGATASALGAGTAYDPATGKLTGFSASLNSVSQTGAVSSATTAQTTVGSALSTLNGNVNNTANIAVKYDTAGGSTITLGATGGTLPASAKAVKITNLAAGTLGSTSTDAVNGSQLYATNQNITTLSGNITSGAIGPVQQTGTTSRLALVAPGGTGAAPGATQTLTNLTAGFLGGASTDAVNGSQLFATNTVVGTLGTSIAAGLGGKAAYDPATGITGFSAALNSVGLTGAVSSATTAQTTVGGALSTLNGNINNTANVAVKYDAAGGSTITLGATGGTLPASAKAVKITNLAAGTLGSTSTDAVNGSQLYATNQNITTLSGNITSGAIGPVQRAATLDKLVLTAAGGSAATPGSVQTLTNLAAGTLSSTSTDAVNGSQLFATNESISNIVNGQAGPFASSQAVTSAQPVASGANALAGGFGASATGAGSAVVGNQATDNGVAKSTVLGTGASIASGLTGSNVALGQGSTVATNAVGATGAKINGADYTFAGSAPAGAVSIGAVGTERTVTNVAAGQLSAASTDAVNGSQLFATNQAVGTLGTQVSNLATNISIGTVGPVQRTGAANQLALIAPGGTGSTPGAAQGLTNVASGTLSATSTDAVNGSQLFATNQTINNIQAGGGIKYFHANSTAANSQANGAGSVAIGPQAVANNAGDVALGSGSTTAAAVATTGGTIAGTAYSYAGTTPTSTVSVGAAGAERTVTNVAAGQLSGTSTDAVNGSQLFATNTAVNSLTSTLGPSGINAVQYDRDGAGNKTNTVTLQGSDPAAPVLIRNVAPGQAATDAANVGQVQAAGSAAVNTANTYTNQVAAQTLSTAVNVANAYTNQVAVQTLSAANAYTDQKFWQLSQDIGQVRQEARQAAAVGLAAASLRYDDRAGKISASMGGGSWQGQGAMALGVGFTSNDSKWRGNVSGSTSGGNFGVGAGLTFTFN